MPSHTRDTFLLAQQGIQTRAERPHQIRSVAATVLLQGTFSHMDTTSQLPRRWLLDGPPYITVDVHSGGQASTAAYAQPPPLSALPLQGEGKCAKRGAGCAEGICLERRRLCLPGSASAQRIYSNEQTEVRRHDTGTYSRRGSLRVFQDGDTSQNGKQMESISERNRGKSGNSDVGTPLPHQNPTPARRRGLVRARRVMNLVLEALRRSVAGLAGEGV
jgi:hypothetical protein